jgi:SAM-dependent methyltransferase
VNAALDGVARAYDASAAAWVAGPAMAYDALADALLAAVPVAVPGARVLDVGAGTGSAARAARRAGAGSVVGVDIAVAMLSAGSGWDALALCDAGALPFRSDTFDVAVAAFCLGHLPDPGGALAESRRVAAAVVASAFAPGWTHPAKSLVDGVAAGFGFVTPPWYVRLKASTEPAVDDPSALAALAAGAGFARFDVVTCLVDTGIRTPGQLTAWRLGMAHLAPFVAALPPGRQLQLAADCAAALAGAPRLHVPMTVLAALR